MTIKLTKLLTTTFYKDKRGTKMFFILSYKNHGIFSIHIDPYIKYAWEK